jgi:adenylate kinase
LGREIHGGKDAEEGETASNKSFFNAVRLVRVMRIALTGTPGTGKSSVGDILRTRGWDAVEVSAIAREAGLLKEIDQERGSYEIDIDELQEAVDSRYDRKEIVLVGHLAHLISNDLCIVLRCQPKLLRSRLAERDWPKAKVDENIEAEALDAILVEAMELDSAVFEIDTSDMGSSEVADAVQDIVAGKIEKYRPGHIDWSSEVLGWY